MDMKKIFWNIGWSERAEISRSLMPVKYSALIIRWLLVSGDTYRVEIHLPKLYIGRRHLPYRCYKIRCTVYID